MINVDWSKAPEGATHWEQESDEWYSSWMMLNDKGWHWWPGSSEGWIKCREVDESRVCAMIPRHPAWIGEGLPPVGMVCEHMGNADQNHDWIKVEVIGSGIVKGHNVAFFQYDCETKGITVSYSSANYFRPIRTLEQLAAEEREKAVDAMVKVWSRTMGRFAHEKRGLAEMLYDAGYRKKEQPE